MTSKSVQVAEDPVVAYDIMREAANRLCGVYASRATSGGIEDPSVQAIRSVRAEVRGIDTEDARSQQLATANFNERYATLLGS